MDFVSLILQTRKLTPRGAQEYETTKRHGPTWSNLKAHALSQRAKLGLRGLPCPAPLRPYPVLHALLILQFHLCLRPSGLRGGTKEAQEPGDQRLHLSGAREGAQLDATSHTEQPPGTCLLHPCVLMKLRQTI